MRCRIRPISKSPLYIAVLLGAIAAFLVIRDRGEMLIAPTPPPGVSTTVASASPDTLWHLLLAMAAVVAVGRLLGRVFALVGQPPVIGEVVGGIFLGPSLLGYISPAAYLFILPSTVAPFLSVVAQLGVILYMFLVGLELNLELLRRRVHAVVATSHASIVAPFVLRRHWRCISTRAFQRATCRSRALHCFLVAMSITAFPVLARILSDRGLTRTELGAIALTCASVDDVTAWCLLAFVVGVVQSSAQSALSVAALTVSFIAFMFVIVRPVAARVVDSVERNPSHRVKGPLR